MQLKSLISLSCLLACLASLPFNSSGDLREEILKLTRIDLLPRFQEDVAVRQISSFDTTGGNDDGFSGRYSFLRKEKEGLVIADIRGKGVIQRIWTPTPTEDTLQFFFDGEDQPRLELKFIDLFSGNRYPFIRPVVGNEIGGYYCYLPIPFSTSCKIVCKGERMQFFQIQYREISGSEKITSFPVKFSRDEEDALTTATEVWKKWGGNPSGMPAGLYGDVKKVVTRVTLEPGQTRQIFKTKKGGRILGLEIIPQQSLNEDFKDLILRAHWDGEIVPAINCPVGDFFGYAFGKPAMESLLAGVSAGTHYSYFPMPFDQKASLELSCIRNELNKYNEMTFMVRIYYTDQKRNPDEGKFYAEWKRIIRPGQGTPYPILKKNGKGHHVGTLLQAQGMNPGMTLFFEGDDQCYVDGELRLHGTGSEDYFNGGWYALPDRWDQAFSLPLHGSLAYSVPFARTGGYRFLLTDKISFEKEISLTIEHGPENNQIPVDYTSVAFYYCDRPPVANNLPTDELLKKTGISGTLEYWIQLLPIKALSNGTTISHTKTREEIGNREFDIFKIDAKNTGFAKFELDVPSSGEYRLLLSYFKGPGSGLFAINQRQVPVREWQDAYAEKVIFIEKEYAGTLNIKQGTNTITIDLKENPGNPGKNSLMLQRVYLEKIL